MVDALSKELYSLKQGSRVEYWLSSECTCHNKPRYSRVPGKDSTAVPRGDKMGSFLWQSEPQIPAHVGPQSGWWTLLVTLSYSLQHGNWKDRQKLEIPCSQRLPWLEDQMPPDHRHWGTGWIFRRRPRNPQWDWWSRAATQLVSSNLPMHLNYTKKKNWNCFRCGSPDHLVMDCPKDLGKVTRKVSLNPKRGQQRREARPLRIQ